MSDTVHMAVTFKGGVFENYWSLAEGVCKGHAARLTSISVDNPMDRPQTVALFSLTSAAIDGFTQSLTNSIANYQRLGFLKFSEISGPQQAPFRPEELLPGVKLNTVPLPLVV